jgi:methyltransferase
VSRLDGTEILWLAIFLAVVAAQRVAELIVSARHARRVRARGAREFGAGHFPYIVTVHVLFFVCLVAEVVFLDAAPGKHALLAVLWPLAVVVWVGAQVLRYTAIRALGERWNVRILVVPGEPLVRSGPYRYFRHPNYVAVVLEFVAAPLMFGAWRTAIVISLLNAIALRTRIRAEDAALQTAGVVAENRA